MKYAKKRFQLFTAGTERKEGLMLLEGNRGSVTEEAAFELGLEGPEGF